MGGLESFWNNEVLGSVPDVPALHPDILMYMKSVIKGEEQRTVVINGEKQKIRIYLVDVGNGKGVVKYCFMRMNRDAFRWNVGEMEKESERVKGEMVEFEAEIARIERADLATRIESVQKDNRLKELKGRRVELLSHLSSVSAAVRSVDRAIDKLERGDSGGRVKSIKFRDLFVDGYPKKEFLDPRALKVKYEKHLAKLEIQKEDFDERAAASEYHADLWEKRYQKFFKETGIK